MFICGAKLKAKNVKKNISMFSWHTHSFANVWKRMFANAFEYITYYDSHHGMLEVLPLSHNARYYTLLLTIYWPSLIWSSILQSPLPLQCCVDYHPMIHHILMNELSLWRISHIDKRRGAFCTSSIAFNLTYHLPLGFYQWYLLIHDWLWISICRRCCFMANIETSYKLQWLFYTKVEYTTPIVTTNEGLWLKSIIDEVGILKNLWI